MVWQFRESWVVKGTFDDFFSHRDLEHLEVGFHEASPSLNNQPKLLLRLMKL